MLCSVYTTIAGEYDGPDFDQKKKVSTAQQHNMWKKQYI